MGKRQCLLRFSGRCDTEKQESIQEVLCRIQKMEWKEQKIILQTIDSLIDSFNEYR